MKTSPASNGRACLAGPQDARRSFASWPLPADTDGKKLPTPGGAGASGSTCTQAMVRETLSANQKIVSQLSEPTFVSNLPAEKLDTRGTWD